MKVSILGIGTELTSGQILNRNAQWISRKLAALGLETSVHLVVPDEKGLIFDSLAYCFKHSDLLFVTGGLGPTTDDFTRDVIADFVGKKLTFDDESWRHIQERLGSRGVPIREAQKQQCYYPEGSKVLSNRMGTAHAFQLSYRDKDIYVLPGPPREIDALWEDYLAKDMGNLAAKVDAKVTLIWNCLGLGESEISFKTEEVLKGCPFEKGYRAHHPYVEVKLSFKQSQSAEGKMWAEKVEETLKDYVVARDDSDAAQDVAALLEKFASVAVIDEVTGSHLLNRLAPHAKKLLNEKRFEYAPRATKTHAELILSVKKSATGISTAVTYKGQDLSKDLISPYQGLLATERDPQYFCEHALLFWKKELTTLTR